MAAIVGCRSDHRDAVHSPLEHSCTCVVLSHSHAAVGVDGTQSTAAQVGILVGNRLAAGELNLFAKLLSMVCPVDQLVCTQLDFFFGAYGYKATAGSQHGDDGCLRCLGRRGWG